MLKGYVCLIGAGPGHAGLITQQGLNYLARADVVLYDRLVPAVLLLHTKPGCELIDVGKEGGKPSWRQSAINELLVEKAKEGHFVVRLKGGDPFLLGRGGEEAQALAAQSIPYILVPGVSSSYAVPAYAGIPVTHREYSSGVTVKSGVPANGKGENGRTETLVILMTLGKLRESAQRLMDQGYPAATPASVISRGSTTFQRVITGCLADIAARVEEARLPTPALLIVGEVVNLHQSLTWHGNLPLYGRRILSTRPVAKVKQDYLEELTLLGAEIVRLPTIEIKPLPTKELQGALLEIATYSWVVFTSATAVEVFCDTLLQTGYDWRSLAKVKIAVIGGATAEALKGNGRLPDLIASEGNSHGMLRTLLEHVSKDEQIALCRARQGLPVLARGLQAAGMNFKEFGLYDLEQPWYEPGLLRKIFADPFDLAIFTSPATARNLHSMLKASGAVLPKRTLMACLGPDTAKELVKLGWQPWLVPAEPRWELLIDDVLRKWGVKKDVSGDQA